MICGELENRGRLMKAFSAVETIWSTGTVQAKDTQDEDQEAREGMERTVSYLLYSFFSGVS